MSDGLTGSGFIDFDEFVDVMRNRWKGMNIGEAVEMIKQEQHRAEKDPNADVFWNANGAVAHRKAQARKPIKIGPIAVPAVYFGEYTNFVMFVRRTRKSSMPSVRAYKHCES